MAPQKRLLSALILCAVAAWSAPVAAQDILGSSIAEAQSLLPEGATPVRSAGDDDLTYKDVEMSGIKWSAVTLHFNASHRLSSVSLTTRSLSYEDLRAQAQAQLQAYAVAQMRMQEGMGTVAAPTGTSLQIRLCQKGDEIEMTYERASQDL